MQPAVLLDLARRDRALFTICADHARTRRLWAAWWRGITHLGGATATLGASTIPLFTGSNTMRVAAWNALATLFVSHIIVQLIKRFVRRPRPSVTAAWTSLAHEPDAFSFPSGHSAAAMAVAISYASVLPQFSLVFIGVALLVGASRVFLGVHYPGDVIIGQIVAIVTAGVLVR